MFEGWTDGIPPNDWPRMLSMDVGGATPNALEFLALDPVSGSVVAYDEVHKITAQMKLLADEAKPKMKSSDDTEYQWKFKVIDYENRIAAEEMKKYGIAFDNAVKHNKTLSVQRFAGYIHPNPKRPFPAWHPRAGQPGAPLFFVMGRCKNLIREIPLQRWKEQSGNMKDEMDRNVPHDTVDCVLYVVRLLPPAPEVKIVNPVSEKSQINLMSALYWEDYKKQREREAQYESAKMQVKVPGRDQPYRPGHMRTLEEVWRGQKSDSQFVSE